MKVVQGWMMEGTRPATPNWDGTGRHPILGMTMDEIKAHAQASVERYVVSADSNVKTPKATPEQELQNAQEHNVRSAELLAEVIRSLQAPTQQS